MRASQIFCRNIALPAFLLQKYYPRGRVRREGMLASVLRPLAHAPTLARPGGTAEPHLEINPSISNPRTENLPYAAVL